MIEMFEKTLLTAVGAMTLSQQKAEELMAELRQKMNVSEEEGRAFLKKVQDAAEANQKKLEDIAQEEVKKASERMGLVTKDELAKLKRRVTQLEKKLKEESNS